MDPIKQITTPQAEVAKVNQRVDEYGETWIMVAGVETKVTSIAAAEKLLAQQDAFRVAVRAALDEAGVRDQTEKVEITLEDGTKDVVDMLPATVARNTLHIDAYDLIVDPVYFPVSKLPEGTKLPELKPGRLISVDDPKRPRFTNSFGCPWFNFNRWGFIFNEGGRVLTLTITKWCPFRVYICGLILTIDKRGVHFEWWH